LATVALRVDVVALGGLDGPSRIADEVCSTAPLTRAPVRTVSVSEAITLQSLFSEVTTSNAGLGKKHLAVVPTFPSGSTRMSAQGTAPRRFVAFDKAITIDAKSSSQRALVRVGGIRDELVNSESSPASQWTPVYDCLAGSREGSIPLRARGRG
jgi:hypothetical protein